MSLFNIIEQKLVGKCSEALCEDGIFISNDIVAIIDGSTSKISKTFNGKKGGRLAMEALKEGFKNIDVSLSPREKLNYLANSIESFKKENNITFPVIASLVFYDARYKKIVSYGDCKALVNGKSIIDAKLSDVVLAEKRSDYIKSFLGNGITEEELLERDLSREYILPYLLKQQSLANIEYPALTGGSIKDSFIKEYEVHSGDMVILASDGYPELLQTLNASENRLNELISSDPLCYKEFKSTKGVYKGNISYDDRAYIRFTVC